MEVPGTNRVVLRAEPTGGRESRMGSVGYLL